MKGLRLNSENSWRNRSHDNQLTAVDRRARKLPRVVPPLETHLQVGATAVFIERQARVVRVFFTPVELLLGNPQESVYATIVHLRCSRGPAKWKRTNFCRICRS